MKGIAVTLRIDLAPDEEALLRQRAAEVGKDLGTFVHDAMLYATSRPSLSELLAPIHDATEKAGISLEEIDSMADRALAEVRAERRSRQQRDEP